MKKLTDKQIEILQLVADGKTDWEIGQILGMKYRNVSNYLRKVYVKMGVVNRVQAAVVAVRLGVIK